MSNTGIRFCHVRLWSPSYLYRLLVLTRLDCQWFGDENNVTPPYVTVLSEKIPSTTRSASLGRSAGWYFALHAAPCCRRSGAVGVMNLQRVLSLQLVLLGVGPFYNTYAAPGTLDRVSQGTVVHVLVSQAPPMHTCKVDVQKIYVAFATRAPTKAPPLLPFSTGRPQRASPPITSPTTASKL